MSKIDELLEVAKKLEAKTDVLEKKTDTAEEQADDLEEQADDLKDAAEDAAKDCKDDDDDKSDNSGSKDGKDGKEKTSGWKIFGRICTCGLIAADLYYLGKSFDK